MYVFSSCMLKLSFSAFKERLSRTIASCFRVHRSLKWCILASYTELIRKNDARILNVKEGRVVTSWRKRVRFEITASVC